MRRFLPLGSCLLVALLATPALAQSPPTWLGSWGSAGGGPGQFQYPNRVATDAAGEVYVADPGRVQIFTGDGTLVSQWTLQNSGEVPLGIALDGIGHVHLLTNPAGNTILHETYSVSGTLLDSRFLAGSGCECALHFEGIAATPIGDSYLTRWGTLNPTGYPSTPVAGIDHFIYPSGEGFWGNPGPGPGQFTNPTGVAVDAAGSVYVADYGTGRIQEYTSEGTFITQWGSIGSGAGQFSGLWGIAVGPDGHVYASDINRAQIQEFTGDGTFVSRWGSPGSGPGQFSYPFGLAVDGHGSIFVADAGNNRIQKFGSAPTPTLHSSWGRLKSIYR
jgi:DNA-binding beta-propeller fold protein YncE